MLGVEVVQLLFGLDLVNELEEITSRRIKVMPQLMRINHLLIYVQTPQEVRLWICCAGQTRGRN